MRSQIALQRCQQRFQLGGRRIGIGGPASPQGERDAEGEQCARYIPCAPEHHHHLVCRGCGTLEEIPAEDVEAGIKRIAATRGFTVLGHTLEVEGLCPRCRA